jgi:hypothetical protein
MGFGWVFGRLSCTALYFTKSGIIKYMMPQGPGPQMGGGAIGAAPGASGTNDPATKMGMLALKLDPHVLGTLLMEALSKAGLSPDAKGLAQLATGGQEAPAGGAPTSFAQMRTPSPQPGILR